MNNKNDILGNRYRLQRNRTANNVPPRQEPVENCPICGWNNAVLISEVDRQGYACKTVVCDKCDFVFNDSVIADPDAFYKNSWATERWVDPVASFNHRTSLDAFSWRRFCFLLLHLKEFFQKKRTIIEIGCGDGCNLLPFHHAGHYVVGLDFNDAFLEPGRSSGMCLLEMGQQSIDLGHKADLVLMVHALEHVKDLQATIDQVSKYVVDGGLVYIEVPGIRGFNRKNKHRWKEMGVQSSNNFLGFLQFQHNFHFDAIHLKYLWTQNGYEVVYCDEFVRALFKRRRKAKKEPLPGKDNDIVGYLRGIEDDFRSPINYIRRILRLISRKIESC